jgi:signal transduction histidine kinase
MGAIIREQDGLGVHLASTANIFRFLLFVPSGLLVTWVSGSLRRAKERADHANIELRTEKEMRERFVFALSHDLRNPIAAAKMNIDAILIRHGEDRRYERALRLASDALVRSDQMIQDLLDANRLEAGHEVPLHLERLDLAQLIRESIEALTARYGNRFSFTLCPASCDAHLDRLGLIRIIDNLASNAVKYGDPETVVTFGLKTDGRQATLTVHNFGRPIPSRDLPKLFELFHRVNPTERSSAHGWGIGLSLVKGMTEAHGGSIDVKSEEGLGTTFSITLPLSPVFANPRQPAA